MNKLFLFLIAFIFIGSMAQAQDASVTGPAITFQETAFDFGDIAQGDTVSHVFKFKNTGTAPLILKEVISTCGCTVPKFSKNPIPPGGSGEIQVKFNSVGKEGRLTKVITVISNATNKNARFNITVNVLPKKP